MCCFGGMIKSFVRWRISVLLKQRAREREPDEQLVFQISRKDDTAADRCGIEAVVVFVGAPLWLKVRASEHRKGLWPRGGSEAKVPSVGRFLPVSHHSVRLVWKLADMKESLKGPPCFSPLPVVYPRRPDCVFYCAWRIRTLHKISTWL